MFAGSNSNSGFRVTTGITSLNRAVYNLNASGHGGPIPDGSITTPKLADGSVTTSKIADQAVTADKIQVGTITPLQIDPSFVAALGITQQQANTSYERLFGNPLRVGFQAGQRNQSNDSVALGSYTGYQSQSAGAVAVGNLAGYDTQGSNSVAIGDRAGMIQQGAKAIAIGYQAGMQSQAPNSIILNASGFPLEASQPGFYVKPILLDDNPEWLLTYNNVTGQIKYAAGIDSIGTQGRQGSIGAQGSVGIGFQGTVGQGLQGTAGVPGIPGAAGVAGAQGATGPPGSINTISTNVAFATANLTMGSPTTPLGTLFTNRICGQQASVDGSLNKATYFCSDILPTVNNQLNIGAPSLKWKSIYIGSQTLYIGNVAIREETNLSTPAVLQVQQSTGGVERFVSSRMATLPM